MQKVLLRAGALAVALLLTACSSSNTPGSGNVSGSSPAAAATSSAAALCKEVSATSQGWLPHDLRLPKGAFVSHKLASRAGFHRAAFMVPMAISAFRRFVRNQWPSAGYVLGRMAVGGKHFSGSFVKPPARGTFLAEERCGGAASVLYLSYAAGLPSPTSS